MLWISITRADSCGIIVANTKLFVNSLGQASCLAFSDIVSCRKNCNISINGDAQVTWLEGKKVVSVIYWFWITWSFLFYAGICLTLKVILYLN